MAIFKCKMCGGALEITENESVATCDYCGTQQTVPSSSDENIQGLFNRANILRMKSEFDKAEQIYEKIIQVDSTQAEAYWGLILCKFGIEYVEDPATFKRIPTCHRTSFDSIIADDDYKSALNYADAVQKNIYETEAKEIDRLQKEIIALSQKEEPYDVFLCYKETDETGKRTQDSVIANDIYYQLTQEGFKVFYAAITLENKLGSAYEPCIFAALNSAKVMLAIGTKPEYFNAVWVKNEWSRFLKMMKKDRSRVLIPCYKDMDAYELPEEFAHLQAQDMSKIGFINDVVRGIKKIINTEEPKAAVVKETVVTSNASAAPLLKRAFMFLEDGDWNSAKEYCEKVLDIEPENAEAYLGKLMAELRVKKQEALKDCAQPFDNSSNYQKAVRFGDTALAEELKGYIAYINERNENARLTAIYNEAVAMKNNAKTEDAYKKASEEFSSISDFKNSSELAEKCLVLAEETRKNKIYDYATDLMKQDAEADYKRAIAELEKIPGWKDVNALIIKCNERIDEIAAEKAHKAEQRKLAAEKAKKKAVKIGAILSAVAVVIIVFVIILNTVIIPNGKYNDAVALMEAEKYQEAIDAFTALGDYKDSKTQIDNCNTAFKENKYNDAVALMEAGKYNEAIAAFEALNGYKDSTTQINNCNTAIMDGKYNDAVALMGNDVIKAYEALIALDGYKDSAQKADSIYEKYKVEKLKAADVGDYVYFGTYEQDNNTSNGKEDIEWLVLDKQDGKVLVISKYALDCQQYNTSDTYVTWETCSLRIWLNNTFINNAFSTEEQALIPTVTVSADKNPEYSTNPGKATQDKVFLLSIAEANKYFNSDEARMCGTTEYAIAQGAWTSDSYSAGGKATCWWWLRSPGDRQDIAAYVRSDGDVYEYGGNVDYDRFAVRPALWISVE